MDWETCSKFYHFWSYEFGNEVGPTADRMCMNIVLFHNAIVPASKRQSAFSYRSRESRCIKFLLIWGHTSHLNTLIDLRDWIWCDEIYIRRRKNPVTLPAQNQFWIPRMVSMTSNHPKLMHFDLWYSGKHPGGDGKSVRRRSKKVRYSYTSCQGRTNRGPDFVRELKCPKHCFSDKIRWKLWYYKLSK